MNTLKNEKKGPFGPAESFLDWFDAQTSSHQIQVALSVVESTPSLYSVAYLDPVEHFREWLEAPIQREIELVARLGTVKGIIDVCFAVPYASKDVQAFAVTNAALQLARSTATNDAIGEEMWRSVQKNIPAFVDSDESFFISWSDLFGKEGPLSDRALYQWLFDESGRITPLSAE